MDDDIAIGNLLKESGLAQSTSEAMRLVKQGAVKINDEKIDDPKLSIEKSRATCPGWQEKILKN